MKDWGMKDWIMELCPEIADWQAEMIAEAAHNQVLDEREACAQIAHDTYEGFGSHAKGVDYVKQHIAIRIRERGAP